MKIIARTVFLQLCMILCTVLSNPIPSRENGKKYYCLISTLVENTWFGNLLSLLSILLLVLVHSAASSSLPAALTPWEYLKMDVSNRVRCTIWKKSLTLTTSSIYKFNILTFSFGWKPLILQVSEPCIFYQVCLYVSF